MFLKPADFSLTIHFQVVREKHRVTHASVIPRRLARHDLCHPGAHVTFTKLGLQQHLELPPAPRMHSH